MNIKAVLLASVLSMPLVVGAALAADTGNALVTAAKQGRQADVQSILKSDAKQEIVATQGGAALIWAAAHNDKAMVDLLLERRREPEGDERLRRDGALCSRGLLGPGRDKEPPRRRRRPQSGADVG